MNLTIDRRTWLRGESQSYLLRSTDGKMCCLGFYALACGLTTPQIQDQRRPMDLVELPESMKWLQGDTGGDSDDCLTLMRINDIIESEREEQITQVFAKHGVIVTFVN